MVSISRSLLRGRTDGPCLSLLESTNIPVKEVAQGICYRQPGQFTKAFKRGYA
jgi:hypothetical protein